MRTRLTKMTLTTKRMMMTKRREKTGIRYKRVLIEILLTGLTASL